VFACLSKPCSPAPPCCTSNHPSGPTEPLRPRIRGFETGPGPGILNEFSRDPEDSHLHAYTLTRVHTYTRTHVRTYTRTYTRTHVHTYIQRTCTRTHTRTHVHTYVHTHMFTHVHTYVHTYTRTHVHTYTHIHGGIGTQPCLIYGVRDWHFFLHDFTCGVLWAGKIYLFHCDFLLELRITTPAQKDTQQGPVR
jgi:hypothetical protein